LAGLGKSLRASANDFLEILTSSGSEDCEARLALENHPYSASMAFSILGESLPDCPSDSVAATCAVLLARFHAACLNQPDYHTLAIPKLGQIETLLANPNSCGQRYLRYILPFQSSLFALTELDPTPFIIAFLPSIPDHEDNLFLTDHVITLCLLPHFHSPDIQSQIFAAYLSLLDSEIHNLFSSENAADRSSLISRHPAIAASGLLPAHDPVTLLCAIEILNFLAENL
jgi:hypothetical protein